MSTAISRRVARALALSLDEPELNSALEVLSDFPQTVNVRSDVEGRSVEVSRRLVNEMGSLLQVLSFPRFGILFNVQAVQKLRTANDSLVVSSKQIAERAAASSKSTSELANRVLALQAQQCVRKRLFSAHKECAERQLRGGPKLLQNFQCACCQRLRRALL